MKRAIATLMFVHRYLGLAFCLIFVIWFASGIVMIYKRMPEYSAEERLARLPPLDAAKVRLTAAEAMAAGDVVDSPRRVLLTSLRSRPLYRFVVEGGTASVYADDGSYLDLGGSGDRGRHRGRCVSREPRYRAIDRIARRSRPMDDQQPFQHDGSASSRRPSVTGLAPNCT